MKILKNFDEKILITDIETWRKECPPAQKKHWKEGRSAQESAKFWLDTKNQKTISDWLSSKFSNIEFMSAAPEFKTAFDNVRGNTRNHDLFIKASSKSEEIYLGLEAKVDESFGETLAVEYLNSYRKKMTKPTSKKFERINFLLQKYFNDLFWGIKYQLLFSIAGLINHAKENKVNKCIFLVQNFIQENNVSNKKIEKNKKSLNNLIFLISKGEIYEINDKEILGPFYLEHNEYQKIELYIAKYTTNL